MQVIKGRCPTQVPQRLGGSEKPVPIPPPDGSSAGESFAKRMTGGGGSPSLLIFLAKQGSQLPAGGGGEVSRSMLRAAVAGRVCKPGRGKIPANITPNTGTPASKGSTQEDRTTSSLAGLMSFESLTCLGGSAFHT